MRDRPESSGSPASGGRVASLEVLVNGVWTGEAIQGFLLKLLMLRGQTTGKISKNGRGLLSGGDGMEICTSKCV